MGKPKVIVQSAERDVVWEWMNSLLDTPSQWVSTLQIHKKFKNVPAFRTRANTAHWVKNCFDSAKMFERAPLPPGFDGPESKQHSGGRPQYIYRIKRVRYYKYLRQHGYVDVPSTPKKTKPKSTRKAPAPTLPSLDLKVIDVTPKPKSVTALHVVPSELRVVNKRGETELTISIATAEAIYEFVRTLHEDRP